MADWSLDVTTIIRHNVIQRLLPACIDGGASATWRSVQMSRSDHKGFRPLSFINVYVFLCARRFTVPWDESNHEIVSNARFYNWAQELRGSSRHMYIWIKKETRSLARPSLENHKAIGLLSNTGPDPLKITKLPSQHSMFGQHRPASEMVAHF